jgi:hypothetical protein
MLGEIAKRRKATVDYQRIWSAQAVDEVLSNALAIIAESVNEDITRPPAGISNISEWCKKDGCWMRLLEQADRIADLLPEAFWKSLASADDDKHESKTARQTQKIDNGIEAQRQVIAIAPSTWQGLCARMSAKRLLTPKEIGIMNVAAQMPSKIPTEGQSRILLGILEKSREEGLVVPELR